MKICPEKIKLDPASSSRLSAAVNSIFEDCPGQLEHRYLARIYEYEVAEAGLTKSWFADNEIPLLISNLPKFADVQRNKILTLLIGEMIGRCVAYSDYNQSYITDVRPTGFSKELSSGTDLLDMHNDLCFASDQCRPRALVLVAHKSQGNVPKTLLAPASMVIQNLSGETKAILAQPHFEIRSGSKLRWPCEQIRRIALLHETAAGKPIIRLSFDNIKPAQNLGEAAEAQAALAVRKLADAALTVGREQGHALREGEALLIPNDHCLHGRDTYDDPQCERMLLRSYVVPESVVTFHNNTMIPLRN